MPKPNLKTIYIVTSGEYSDYNICGVFSSREYADSFIEASCPEGEWLWSRKEDYRIETYLIDDLLSYALTQNAKVEYVFWFDLDFNLMKQACNKLLKPPPLKNKLEDWLDEKTEKIKIGWIVRCHMLPGDPNRAFKVAVDILHQHRAQSTNAQA